jgi:hypothetical protein
VRAHISQRRATAVGVAVLLSLVLAGSGIQPAAGAGGQGKSGDHPSRSLSTLEVTQARMHEVADELDAEVKREGLQGFAGLVVAPETSEMTIYWRGAAPPAVQRIAASTGNRGIRAAIKGAPYSLDELKAFRDRIIGDAGFRSSGISLLEVNPSGDGLTIGLRASEETAKQLGAIAQSSIAVRYIHADPQPLYRWRDTPPFWGGAWISDVSYSCTSGFPARRSNPTEYYMITAGHCFGPNLGDQWFAGAGIGATGLVEGVSWAVSPSYDGGIIRLDGLFGTPGGGGANRIYTGGVDVTASGYMSPESSQLVRSKSANLNGDIVTVSGAYSGEVGGNRIVANEAIWALPINGITWFMHGSHVNQVQHLGAVGFGDSGGPVYVYASGGVSARGIVSAGYFDNTGPCQGAQTAPCTWDWLYGDINGIVSDLNITLNVG